MVNTLFVLSPVSALSSRACTCTSACNPPFPRHLSPHKRFLKFLSSVVHKREKKAAAAWICLHLSSARQFNDAGHIPTLDSSIHALPHRLHGRVVHWSRRRFCLASTSWTKHHSCFLKALELPFCLSFLLPSYLMFGEKPFGASTTCIPP